MTDVSLDQVAPANANVIRVPLPKEPVTEVADQENQPATAAIRAIVLRRPIVTIPALTPTIFTPPYSEVAVIEPIMEPEDYYITAPIRPSVVLKLRSIEYKITQKIFSIKRKVYVIGMLLSEAIELLRHG